MANNNGIVKFRIYLELILCSMSTFLPLRAINSLVNPKTSLCVKVHYVAYGDATVVDDLLPVKRKPLYLFHSKFST